MNALNKLVEKYNKEVFKKLHEEMSFSEYLDLVYDRPKLARDAFQIIYDMIMSFGSHEYEKFRKRIVHYNFFDQVPYPIFGADEKLDEIVNFIKGAAGGYGTDQRVLLLHGPVGSAKSTIARRFKRGMEQYSRTDDGAIYTYKWINLPEDIYTSSECPSPMHEDPIKLIPLEDGFRQQVLDELNEVLKERHEGKSPYKLKCEGQLNPRCRKFMYELMKKNDGDWLAVVNKHIRVVRMVYSEADRVGIATFQPKDEKNQDSTELTGDIDWRLIAHFGSDSDPRAFSFDGEFCVGNRGFVEFIEMLKLQQEFLYDLLGATQENQIKPKKFSQVSIREFIMGHTNNPEYQKLVNNNSMEALRDRTVKVDIPYLTVWSEEIKVLEQDYNKDKVRQHIAPHTLEIAALWAILTRLYDDRDSNVDLLKKAKLYNGESVQGFNEDAIMELMEKSPGEGMFSGVSVRYLQEKISNCLSEHEDYISPFMVVNAIREGLDKSSLITNKEAIARYHTCADLVIKELDDILKNEVRKALVGDEKAIERLCANYIDNLIAYNKKTKIKNKITGRDEPPNERLMRSIEEKIGIPQKGVDDFRMTVASFMGELSHANKTFRWDSNVDLKKALEAKLFEDVKDHIKLSALNVDEAATVDPEMQAKIDAIKQRLITQYGYNEQSATDILQHVGSIFNRGETEED